MKLDYPAAQQLPQMRRLWKLAFGDEDSFLDAFFSLGFSTRRCRCVMVGDALAAVLYWFDVSCADRKLAYLYAVATDPGHRGRGYCRKLVEDAKTLLKNSGYQGMLLLPQNEPLRQMYEKMGFHTCSFVTEFSCEPGEKPADLRIVDQVEYARLRRKLLPEDGVVQEGAMLDLLNSQAVFLAGTDYLAVGYVDADTLRCQELLGNARRAPEILRAMGCAQGVFRCPGGEKAFAMLCPLTEDCPERIYFGLPLD